MIEITAPETPTHRMELVAEPRQERGAVAPFEPTSWIELSEPFAMTLKKEPVDDKELAQFLSANKAQYRYDYVKLGCSFGPKAPEKFEKAWLMVTLKAKDAKVQIPPVSWSIYPLGSYDEVEESTSAKIGAAANIVKAEIGASSKLSKKIFSLRGYKEGGPEPFWEMMTTNATSLEGILRFHMIVRSAAKAATVGEVRLQAVISNRVFVAFRQKRPFDKAPSMEFQLPPA